MYSVQKCKDSVASSYLMPQVCLLLNSRVQCQLLEGKGLYSPLFSQHLERCLTDSCSLILICGRNTQPIGARYQKNHKNGYVTFDILIFSLGNNLQGKLYK